MIKLVCFDLDGTLHDNSWKIPVSLNARLRGLHDQGIKAAVTTGRELLGSLYFVQQNDFYFDFLCPGGSSYIKEPKAIDRVDELYNSVNVDIFKRLGGLGKLERVVGLASLLGIPKNETLFIDDGLHKNDMASVHLLDEVVVGCVDNTHPDWVSFVSSYENGYVSSARGTAGTLEVLNKFC